jgi:UDP-glucose 4-epimerase
MRDMVLVTGGAGYIGSHAVLALQEAGFEVAVLDNLTTGFRWAVPADVTFYQGDVADAALVDHIVQDVQPKAIMHFAGSIIVPESVSDPLKYYRNNTAASRSLIESAVRNGIRHFIFSSTAAVYGAPDVQQVDELCVCRPINPYGTSKLMTEAMLADVALAHDFNYAALRYFNVAGADPLARTGQSTAGATHLIKIAVEAALSKRAAVTVFGSDYATADGTGVRDYIHVSDLVMAHVAALHRLVAEPQQSMIMNCGYGHGASVIEVLDAVDRVAGVTLKRIAAPRRPGDSDALVASVTRIHTALDWRPRYDSLETIIAHALAWEQHLAQRPAD